MQRLLMTGLLAMTALPVHADIYKCTDAAGHVTYSNVLTKGCARMTLDPISSIPPARPAAKAPTPATFPRVEEGVQKARDNDRRKILEQEQAAEQANLEAARKRLAEAEIPQPGDRNVGGGINQARLQERLQPMHDQIQLHERNLEALRKELQNLR